MQTPTVQPADQPASVSPDRPPARTVAIQGIPGAFHDIAARQFYGTECIALQAAHTFEDLVRFVSEGTVDTALMAIENTLAGSIMGNYRLLLQSDLTVTGEVYLRIRQNLLALPGQTVEQLREVHSHPMAIAQCEAWFRQYPHLRLVETEDTALSARLVRDNQWISVGAIASERAAEMYGLDILAHSIETNKQNYTRFLVLERETAATISPNADKVSLCFSLSHEVGSLHRVLSVMAAYDLNLTKIQSSPISGSPWEYFFFVDFICAGRIDWRQAVDSLRPLTADIKVLGVYQQGNRQF
ncbi:MAG: hypothetical protein RLY31_3046 [Bacteroidota bacterium]|jgi:prephenate dehydratase